MRSILGTGLAFALALAAAPASAQQTAPAAPKNQAEFDKVLGTYTIVKGMRGDKFLPQEEIEGRVTITRDKIVTYDKDNKEVYTINYNLAGDGTPYKILMKVTHSSRPDAEGTDARGLLRAEGNRALLIYDYAGTAYPSEFETKTDSQLMFELKKVERDEDR